MIMIDDDPEMIISILSLISIKSLCFNVGPLEPQINVQVFHLHYLFITEVNTCHKAEEIVAH